MKRVLSWLIGVPVALIIIVAAVANREPVTFSLDPFSAVDPWFSVELPLYAILVAAAIIGMLIGGTSAWIGQRKWRQAARKQKSEIRALEDERNALRKEIARHDQIPATADH